MREKDTGRACGTLALAIKGFSSRLECMEFFSDVKAIEVGSQVLVGKAGARHHIWFRRTDRPGQPARVVLEGERQPPSRQLAGRAAVADVGADAR